MSLDSTQESTTETTNDVTPETSSNESVSSEQQVETPTPEFTPNYKYKAYGKEYEMDEWARPLVNSQTQEHLVKLFEKAGGFEPLKDYSKKTEGELKALRGSYQELETMKNRLSQSIARGELDSAFGMLGLDDNKIMDYVRAKLQYNEMTPEQKQAYEYYRSVNQQKFEYEDMLREQQKLSQELMIQKHEMERERVFTNPKYAQVIESYNARSGENAFEQVVNMIGSNEYYSRGVNIPVEEAVSRAMQYLGLQHQEQNHINQAGFVQQQRPNPTPIPNLGKGSSAVPVKKQIKTLDDLLKARDEAFSN